MSLGLGLAIAGNSYRADSIDSLQPPLSRGGSNVMIDLFLIFCSYLLPSFPIGIGGEKLLNRQRGWRVKAAANSGSALVLIRPTGEPQESHE